LVVIILLRQIDPGRIEMRSYRSQVSLFIRKTKIILDSVWVNLSYTITIFVCFRR